MKKICIDKNFILSSAYDEYKYLLEFMNCKGNYNKPGVSDYPFYAYYSTLVDNTTILEVGTSEGGSATMMSHNQTNKIISYDIIKHHTVPDGNLRGIDFRIGNFMKDDIDYNSIDLITIDAAHNGHEEIKMVKYLEKKWKGGLLFLDDINLGQMQDFWKSIDRNRHELFDISDIAHGNHGSGLVNFNRYFDITIIG